MNILVLFSNESFGDILEKEIKWTTCLCSELTLLFGLRTRWQMLFDRIDKNQEVLAEQINKAERIIVIVNESLVNNFRSGTNLLQPEKALLKRIDNLKDNPRDILLLMKQEINDLPECLKCITPFKFSWLNYQD